MSTISAKSAKETAKILKSIIESEKNRETNLSCGIENPQVYELVIKIQTRREAFEAVLQALEGNPILLKTFF